MQILQVTSEWNMQNYLAEHQYSANVSFQQTKYLKAQKALPLGASMLDVISINPNVPFSQSSESSTV